MQKAIDETAPSSENQMAYNERAWHCPTNYQKIRDLISVTKAVAKEEDKRKLDITSLIRQERKELVNCKVKMHKKLSKCLTSNWQRKSRYDVGSQGLGLDRIKR